MTFNTKSLLLILLLTYSLSTSTKLRKLDDFYTTNLEMKDGIYIIKNSYDNLVFITKNNILYSTSSQNKSKYTYFHIAKASNDGFEDNNSYYYISEKDSDEKLYVEESSSLVKTSKATIKEDKFLWEITKKSTRDGTQLFYLKNKLTERYLTLNDENIVENEIKCESYYESNTNALKIIRLYTENNLQKINNNLLENEPIDIVIRYVQETELLNSKPNWELKYCLRSIYKNIPWIRKIFIITSNNQISFLKNNEELNDKIILIKEEELLGFETTSDSVYLFNLQTE